MKPPGKARKKVCVVTPEYPPEQWGGLARTVRKVSLHAAQMGLEVHVARLSVAESSIVLLDENRTSGTIDGIHVHSLAVGKEEFAGRERELWDCPHTLTLKMMYQSLEMLHRHERFDLFHSFFLYPMGFVTGMLAKRMRVPSIVTLVGNDMKKYVFSPEKVAVCRSGLENANRVVALSRDMIEMANALTPIEHKAKIIYNSVELPVESWKARSVANGPFIVGCAGIFKYAKGLPYLFKAVATLRSRRPLVLELVGHLRNSEQSVYDAMVARTGIKDILIFKGPIAHEKMPEWLGSLDAFVLPSVSEGCPNILMEAMASGLPCVATRTGAVEDLVQDRVSGLLVPWGDSEAICDALTAIIQDRTLAESLGAEARDRMKQFDATRERKDWESVYGELIDL